MADKSAFNEAAKTLTIIRGQTRVDFYGDAAIVNALGDPAIAAELPAGDLAKAEQIERPAEIAKVA